MIMLLLVQAAATAVPPDISIQATVRARSVTIEEKGQARLAVRASPDGGSKVEVEAPRADGRDTLRNVRVTIDAEARIADPLAPAAQNPQPPETPPSE